jgi:hypothetical protein
MDKHDRPYRCSQPECFNLPGFTYSGGLLRHEREVHFKHGGPEPHPCPEPGCSNLPMFASASALSRHTREVHSKRGGPKEILRCPVDECKRHVGKAFSRMDGLVKHLAAIHGIKKSSAEVRRDYSFRSESPNRQGPRKSVGGHGNASPGPRLQEDIAPREQFKFFDDKTLELKEEQRQLDMRELHLVEERRLLNVRLEQHDIDRRERQNLRDEVVRLALREQQNKARMLAVQQELDSTWAQFATSFPLPDRLDPHEQRDHDMRSIWEDVEPRGDTMNAEDATAVLRRHQAQLTTLEQQHEMRVSMTQQEQDSTPPQPVIPSPSPDQLGPLPVPDYRMQLMLLEQKNKKRLLMARQEQNSVPPQLTVPLPHPYCLEPDGQQRYERDLWILEQQNKERLLKARQEQDRQPSHAMAYDQHAVSTTMHTPTPYERTMFPPETQLHARQEQEEGIAPAETSMQAHTPHNSENSDFTLFGGPSTATLPAIEPSNLSTVEPSLRSGPEFTSSWIWEHYSSDQSAPDYTYPRVFPEPEPGFTLAKTIEPLNFGRPYSPTGSNNADAGSITTEPALASSSGQAVYELLLQEVHED